MSIDKNHQLSISSKNTAVPTTAGEHSSPLQNRLSLYKTNPLSSLKTFQRLIATTILCLFPLLLTSCNVYTFSGSTLPSHIKTVMIPVFVNKTLEPGIDDDITTELSKEVLKSQLRPANSDADATISGAVTRYVNRPHTFGAGGAEVSVEQYIVQVSAEVEFFDNRKEESIYKGTVSGEGIYLFESEDEAVGRDKAVKNLVEKIMQNSVQMW